MIEVEYGEIIKTDGSASPKAEFRYVISDISDFFWLLLAFGKIYLAAIDSAL